MKRILLIIVFFGVLYSSFAQNTKQQDTISPEKEKDIIYLLKTSGTADFAYIIIDDVIQNYKKFISETPKDYWDKMAVNTDIMPFIKAVVYIYDKRFSHQEIKELIKFFDSPVGNKWSLSLKDMNQEVMKEANLFGQKVFTDLNKKLMEDGYIVKPEVEESEDNTKTNNKPNNKK